MDSNKLVFGSILLVISVWMFIALDDFNARFIGGSIVGILAIANILQAIMKKKK
ncbi:hypothetical protein SAMN02745945_01099 [Peptoclostridium litorale DSM 5388]|uniref:Uncharacterized protein n=1 Tax=Peptoclostridium litorale DSM 5388 TaxID=1121324 RepID=A0A069RE28_PEPLI|nr:hypothetical protein [Peptoclostridium litorale]KDR93902.1 hypothetical protein CLIT_23c01740 [Peptoclostridium litorale DSM 5388]KDR95329.1 hypothetical protein CLIT_10c00560 [Peptoclostridium litorale DSM 5388]SIN88221.1 hypothetical protein SAMN02745945_01099 [Peptoclostridium litorale DSM 5388]